MRRTKMARLRALHRKLDLAKRTLDFEVNQHCRGVEIFM